MLLTPNLDYQLMEHWSPSLSELLSIEAEEKAADTSGEAPPQPAAPKQLRRQFSTDAEVLMQADVLEKCKDLIAGHKQVGRHGQGEGLGLELGLRTREGRGSDASRCLSMPHDDSQ